MPLGHQVDEQDYAIETMCHNCWTSFILMIRLDTQETLDNEEDGEEQQFRSSLRYEPHHQRNPTAAEPPADLPMDCDDQSLKAKKDCTGKAYMSRFLWIPKYQDAFRRKIGASARKYNKWPASDEMRMTAKLSITARLQQGGGCRGAAAL